METRSSRYLDEKVVAKPKMSRANKNKYLYDDVNKKIGYEEIDSFSGYNGVVLDKKTPIKTREEYQKVKDYSFIYEDSNIENVTEKVCEEEKVYDINSVLEEAKKNRVIPAELEKKRKLQNAEYSILADLNKKYISKKEKMEEELEREGIRELIDTITSKTLVNDVDDAIEEDDKDLLSELLATGTLSGADDFDLEEEIAKEILAETKENADLDEIKEDDGKLINSFYTRSMDLSEQDFEFKEEIVRENKEKRKILILIVLIILVVLGIISIYILKKINII
jgi:hypothetical protein